eukprot:TRINITY_DN5242_c0_g1_i1.p1 TRINITY_DN5242_c0_g1~~TRINITY_DN5242_c0_g1_i1.p1  ORF type:complete len:317 (+),score=119.37 TRINITY_DN5242_c0_g1_i1:96-1046(+)
MDCQGDDLMAQFRVEADHNDIRVGFAQPTPAAPAQLGPGAAESAADGDGSGDGISEFYKIFAAVQKAIEELKVMTGALEKKYNDLELCTDTKTRYPQLLQEVSAQRKAIYEKSKEGKAGLDSMAKITEAARQTQSERPTELRMQQNQYMLAANSYRDALQAFQRVDAEGEKNRQKTGKRRQELRDEVAGPADGPGGGQMQQQRQQQRFSAAAGQTAQVYADWVVGDREAMHKLEQEMQELHQIFQDMAVLVDEQGDLINDVRHNVDTAIDYVVKGRSELKAARAYTRRTTRRKCYLLVCVVIAIGIGVVVMGSFLA